MGISTFLSRENLERIQKQFADEKSYIDHMGSLWKIRAFAVELMGGYDCIDRKHEAFFMWKFANDTIGSLLKAEYTFNDLGICLKNGKLIDRNELGTELIECEIIETYALE